MIDHGYANLPLSRIVLPGDFGAYTKAHQAEVDELSGARKALLLAHAPTVDKHTMTLIAGRRRFAGLLNDGVKRTWIHLVEGTPAELRRLTASENLHRGHADDLSALRVAYVEETAAEVEAERAELPPDRPRKAGRPVTAKGEARVRAARDLGTTPEALRKAESREAAKTAPASITDGPRADSRSSVEMHGMAARAEWLRDVNQIVVALGGIDGKLRGMQTSHVALQMGSFPSTQQAARLALQEAGASVRGMIPHCACVFCRDPDGSAGRRAKCSACGDLGYLTAEQAQRAPAEQLQPGAAPVARENARPAPASVKPAPGWPTPKVPPAKAPERRRGMQIEVDGKMVPARDLVIEREPDADDGTAF